ncbi:MAG TPA: hypothetical protein VMV48_12235 [Gallionellaceae bacterium]|nr:hypothetical protein [Gallionellaceae bacterium]
MKGEAGGMKVSFEENDGMLKPIKFIVENAFMNLTAPSVLATNSSTFSFDQVLTTATRDKSETTKTNFESKTICERKAVATKNKEIKKIFRLLKPKPKTRTCNSRIAATKRTEQGSDFEGARNIKTF